jgi:8-oxo-dGTP diphosphatase
VRAAGGIPVRRRGDGEIEVLLVHRPKYADWTFPKGKVKDGERDEVAAVREVEEETGLRCGLGPELASTRYTDPRLRKKTVRYWAMESCSGRFEPGDEVDEVAWLTLAAAAERLSYERDRDVLRSLVATR